MYQITNLSESQLQIIQDALELYWRIKINQLSEVASKCQEDLYIDDFCNLRDDLEAIQKKGYLQTNWHKNNKVCIAFDLYGNIRYKLSWDRHPEGGLTVNFDEPLHWGSEPLCKVEKVSDADE